MIEANATPVVDVVIAVHQPTRPVDRAVGSILRNTSAPVRVTVVVHNIRPQAIIARLHEFERDSRLRIVTYVDNIFSPAGPMNYGFSLATAPYVSLLGSDDEFEKGAIDAWLDAARMSDGCADAVIAPTADPNTGTTDSSPPIRWTKAIRKQPRVLNPVKDRLAYRAAPLGLIGRERFAHLRFVEGLQTGEDQAFSVAIWFSPGARVVFPIHAPRYLEHADQLDRVTRTSRSVEEEFRSLDHTFASDEPWIVDPAIRLALVVKFVRVHFFDAARARAEESWSFQVAAEMAVIGERLTRIEPRLVNLLSRDDEALFCALLNNATPVKDLSRLLAGRTHLRSAGALLPTRLRFAFHSQAPLRFHLARLLLSKITR